MLMFFFCTLNFFQWNKICFCSNFHFAKCVEVVFPPHCFDC
jgi:hypothetical protein